jgi:hypothetical protein
MRKTKASSAQVHLMAQVVGPKRHIFARRHPIGIRAAHLLRQGIVARI